MDPQAQQSMTLNRDTNDTNTMPQQPPMAQQLPYAAYPATQPRDFDPNIYTKIAELVDRKYGAEINPIARDFEISRVYNKLEIEIFEMSTSQLPQDKQQELQQMTEEAQGNPAAQQAVIGRIQEFMRTHVPDIGEKISMYMIGFQNQYMAGRF